MPSLQPAGGHFATARGCARCTTLSLIGRELRTTPPRAVGWPSTTRICSVTTLSWIGDPISRATLVSVPLQSKCDPPQKKYAVHGPCVASTESPFDDLETPVKNLLTRPGWRPALVMVSSGFVGLLPAPQGRADEPDFHHAPARPRASRTRTAVRRRRHKPAANSTRSTAPRVMGAARKATAIFRRSRTGGCRTWRTARFFGSSPRDPTAARCRHGLRYPNSSVGNSLLT